MAVAAGGKQDMEDFVRSVFQGSPDLSILTHTIIRKKYLSHIQRESLSKEEKEQLKRLVEEELVQLQVDDSPSSAGLSGLQTSVKSGGQKRLHSNSDTSGDEVRSRQEQKKQRTGKESEVSSDEEDSGIDSKKIPVHGGHKRAGKFSSSSDQGDSGAEGHSDGSGSNGQSAKDERMKLPQKASRAASGWKLVRESQGGRQWKRSGSDSDETKEEQQSDLEEETRGCKDAAKGQRTKYESNSDQKQKGSKLQKQNGFDKGPKRSDTDGKGKKKKVVRQRGGKESESEEENRPSALRKIQGKMRVDHSDSEEEKEVGGSRHKAKVRTGQRTWKAQGESEGESGRDSGEKDRMWRKMKSNKYRKKSVSAEELGSDSDQTKDKIQVKKEVPKSKARKANRMKQSCKSESDSEEEERPKRQVDKGGARERQRKNVSRKELEDNEKSDSPEKKQGMHKPKKSVSSDELDSEMDEHKGPMQKNKGVRKSGGRGGESQSEAEERGKSQQVTASSDESESESEESKLGGRRKERVLKQRRSKDGCGSESSQGEEKLKKKGAQKSQKKSVSEMESETEDSGNELGIKKKNEGSQKKGTQKPKRRSNSKEELGSESAEEGKSSGSEDNPSSFKQQHRGKDTEHSGKSEDHPSIRRLKRYIRECGVRRNYKKLLAGCRSRKSQVESLKKELEDLGLKGTPSLAKCKALKQKREEAAEVASLDLSNIITTEGRPRRRNIWSLYSKPQESSSSPEDTPIRRPTTDWSHLRGVISSDGESS